MPMFSREDAKNISADVRQAIENAGLLEKYGMTISRERGKFGAEYGLTITFDRADAEGYGHDAREYLSQCEDAPFMLAGLTAEHLGAPFVGYKGDTFIITGWNGSVKFNLNVTRVKDGRKQKYPAAIVAKILGVYETSPETPFVAVRTFKG
jgi:hypothetical protein